MELLGIFIFLKQIVDMFYKWQILDILMVFFAICLIGYGFIHEKQYLEIRSKVQIADFYILGLMLLFFLSFLRDTGGLAVFVKIESCFLLYYLGRVYGNRIVDNGKWLALAAYIVIYLNLIVRFIHFGYKLTANDLNDGGMYYYKTDLAIGVIIASIFIYVFGKNKVLKIITIALVASYLVLYSGARMQQPVLILLYALFVLNLCVKIDSFKRKIIYNVMAAVFAILIVAVLVAIQFFPFEKYEEALHATIHQNTLLERIFHARHIYWFDIFYFMREQSFLKRTIGFDMNSIWTRNIYRDRAHSEYVTFFYEIGYLGIVLFLGFIKNIMNKAAVVKNNQLRKAFIYLIAVFLITGLTIETLEYTQMSWFTFLFAGALITEEKTVRENKT